jgi:hypothetical protein
MKKNVHLTTEILKKNNWIIDKRYAIDVFGGHTWTTEIENYSITIDNLSNRKNCEWHVHIDNDDYESIANLDFEYVEEFNMFMELLEINLKLKS